MKTDTQNTPTQETASIAKEKIVAGKFNGAFKTFAANWYHLLKFYGLSEKASHKVAADAMSAMGQAMSKDSDLSAAVSKANKHGESSFKITGKSGLTKHSYAMSIIRICQLLEKIREEKLTYKPLKVADVGEFLQPTLTDYVSNCEAWDVELVKE